MKKRLIQAAICFMLSSSMAYSADDEYYFGIKIGKVLASSSGYDAGFAPHFYDDVTIAGIAMGYKMDQNLAIVGEFASNLDPGVVSSYGSGQLEWNLQTIAVHGVYKSNGYIHLRMKAGLTHTKVDNPAVISSETWAPKSASDFTYGLGLGFDTSSGKEIVVEYTVLSDDLNMINFMLVF